MAANLKDPPRHHYTLEEYFALERVGVARYEYWNGEIVCMSGGSRRHVRISGNVYFSLRQQLAGRPCDTFTGDLQIKTPLLPPYRYPDVSVVCGQPDFENIEGFDVLVNPVLIVEVLSPGTASRDRNEKREAYQALPSLREYLLISQDAPHITHYLRQADGWARHDYGDLAATVDLPSVQCRMSLMDVYYRVDFN
ncbi:MAG TPA: Uma2 family endonuclease [Blastocatellia bacterium]|nr:Uma2 family endonuclease [Blastocatellia bacterium]